MAAAVTVTPGLIALVTYAPTARCPHCDHPSDHAHSRYTRTAADLPWQDRRVILRVTA